MFSDPIPWNAIVEFFEACPDLRVRERSMTLRQAVECFREIPADARSSYGVGIHKPVLMMIGGRPVAVGFINASTLEQMIALLPEG